MQWLQGNMLFHKIKDTYVQYMSHCEIDSNLIVVTIIINSWWCSKGRERKGKNNGILLARITEHFKFDPISQNILSHRIIRISV